MPLREEVVQLKLERDRFRYEYEWATHDAERLRDEIKELEKTNKAEKDYSAELNRRLTASVKECEQFLQGLTDREKDVQQMTEELDALKLEVEKHNYAATVTETRGLSPVKAGVADRRVDFEVENQRLKASVKDMRRKLKENDNADYSMLKAIDDARLENAMWESARLERARKAAEAEEKRETE